MWGIIGHVTVEAGSTVGTDGAPPQFRPFVTYFDIIVMCSEGAGE